ncbi:MAG: alpha/beta fold hydrolase [Acidimicrobiia bacterium]|nr:alpha/beta fold hydrolase [Acidimicrobiia bacterium]
MRARVPDSAGVVDRDGVEIYYEVHGDAAPTLLLIPPAPITHSQIFKAQVPHLARHFRVVTFDARGNGKSGRSTDKYLHSRAANVKDAVAVMDATSTERAVLVAHCHANWWAIELIDSHPDRVVGWVAIDPGVPYLGKPQPHWVDTAQTFDQILDNPQGWELFNRHVITNDHRRWVEFFFGSQLVEPHSTKQLEDAVGWALESTGEVLVAGEEGADLDPPSRAEFEAMVRAVEVPVLVIHGTEDVCQAVEKGVALASATNGDLLVIEGAGHLTLARDPVRVNRAITGFVNGIEGENMRRHTWTRGLDRQPKALYVSSPIGLGHARRDIAVAKELQKLRPDLHIDWLAQDPVTRVLDAEGESIHPASEFLASESAHFVEKTTEHDLHAFQALREMDEILVANFMVFQEVVEEGLYDLIIADEAWEIDHFWHENPELKRGSHVWFTDFVGYLPMPSGGEREAYVAADYNAEMIEHIARFPRVRDQALFVGTPDDIVPESFGMDLPKIKDWTREHFGFPGYITGFVPPDPADFGGIREELGFADGEHVVVVTVGGSGVGRALLEKIISAYPLAKSELPDLRMIVVAGPRIDPDSLPEYPGLEIRGYVPQLYRHLSVCDLAVVQGGLTTCMELTAARRPFLYFPLRNHFEQNYHVRHRLDRYGAGKYMDYVENDAESIAGSIVTEVGRDVDYAPVETQGAARAAQMVAHLI